MTSQSHVNDWVLGFCVNFRVLQKKLLFLLFLEAVYNTRKKHRNLSRKRCHKSRGISNFKFSNQKIVGIGTKVEIYRRSGLFSGNSPGNEQDKMECEKMLSSIHCADT